MCDRYRHEFRSDQLFTEIKFVLEQFCTPFLQLLQNTDNLITQHGNDKEALKILFGSLHLMCKIYYSLNAQDIPEFFEDNQVNIMPIFLKYLTYSSPLLEVDSDGDEAGPMERVKTSICEIVDLYTKKYEDVFPALPQFVETIWGLLTRLDSSPKNDLVRYYFIITYNTVIVLHSW